MTYFCHIDFERVRADLNLLPLPAHTRLVIDRLLAGECINREEHDSSIDAALARLAELGLAEEGDVEVGSGDIDHDGIYVASWLLEQISVRGMLDALLGGAA